MSAETVLDARGKRLRGNRCSRTPDSHDEPKRLQGLRGSAGHGRTLVSTVLRWVQLFVLAVVDEFKTDREDLKQLLSGPSADRSARSSSGSTNLPDSSRYTRVSPKGRSRALPRGKA